MDQLKQELAATRKGLRDTRIELANRPTKKQFYVVIGAAILVVMIVVIGAVAAVLSANDSGDAADAAKAVKDGFFISACRTDINAKTVVVAQQNLDEAIQVRASAVAKRDNLTNEALAAIAAGDDATVKRIAGLTEDARNLVTLTDAAVLEKVKLLDSARKDYQGVLDRSIHHPAAFMKECQSCGD